VWLLCCVLCLVVSCVCVSCQVCVECGVLYLLLSINGMIRRSPACSRKKNNNNMLSHLIKDVSDMDFDDVDLDKDL
jgi:hypothetical protein